MSTNRCPGRGGGHSERGNRRRREGDRLHDHLGENQSVTPERGQGGGGSGLQGLP